MYDLKKSDAVIVAVKQANNGRSTPCGVSGAKGRNRREFGRLKDAPYSVCGESVMEVDRIRKAAKRNPEGCPTFRVLPAQRVGIPKPIEASRDQHPTGRWKRPLGTAKAVKDTLSVSALSRSFSGYSYGLQRPWPDQRPFVIIRGRSPVR